MLDSLNSVIFTTGIVTKSTYLRKEACFNSNDKFRYQLVDYLTNTGIYEWVIFSGHPQEVPSFSTIGMTFDMSTWALVTVSLCTVTSLLFIIDIRWNYINNCSMTKMSTNGQGHQGVTDKLIY